MRCAARPTPVVTDDANSHTPTRQRTTRPDTGRERHPRQGPWDIGPQRINGANPHAQVFPTHPNPSRAIPRYQRPPAKLRGFPGPPPTKSFSTDPPNSAQTLSHHESSEPTPQNVHAATPPAAHAYAHIDALFPTSTQTRISSRGPPCPPTTTAYASKSPG
jgi:hypothetical protein